MARPLQATYSPTHPYVVERHDQDDGSITYEVWDRRPDSYRRLCSLNEYNDSETYSDDERRPKHSAKSDAEKIASALNDALTKEDAGQDARLLELLAKYPEQWEIEKEPHSYPDGTTEFTHVRYIKKTRGQETCITIGTHVTPDLAELLILLRKKADQFAAR